jgi:uncharacterized protein YcnI
MPLPYGIPYQPPVGSPDQSLAMPIIFFDDFIVGGTLDADQPTVASSQNPKFSELADHSEWLCTCVDSDGDDNHVVGINDVYGGELVCTTNPDILDNNNCQLNGAGFKWSSGKSGVFEIRMKITDVSTANWFVGLAVPDTDILTAVADRIGFECPDNTGDIDAVSEKNATQSSTDTTSNLADGTYVTLRVEWDGANNRARFYVDGSLKATHTSNNPDDVAMSPAFQVFNSAEGTNTMTIDYILVMQDR